MYKQFGKSLIPRRIFLSVSESVRWGERDTVCVL